MTAMPEAGNRPAPPLDGEVLDRAAPQDRPIPHSAHFDVGAVINKALKAAGLIKS
jgi:hypothetical protein